MIQGKAPEKRKRIPLILTYALLIGKVKRKWKAIPPGPLTLIICPPSGAAFSPERQKRGSLAGIITDGPSIHYFGPSQAFIECCPPWDTCWGYNEEQKTILMFDFFPLKSNFIPFPSCSHSSPSSMFLIPDHLHHFGKTPPRMNRWSAKHPAAVYSSPHSPSGCDKPWVLLHTLQVPFRPLPGDGPASSEVVNMT